MKMTKEDYNLLKSEITTYLNKLFEKGSFRNIKDLKNFYKDNKIGINHERRMRFDLLYKSNIWMPNLYDYLNDIHIETALNRIINEIEKEVI